MTSPRRYVIRTICVLLTAMPAAVIGLCVVMIVIASRSTEDTDGPGMVIFSGLFTAVCALPFLALFLFMTVKLWNDPKVAAGWYVDPTDETSWRFWDGQVWTAHTAERALTPAP